MCSFIHSFLYSFIHRFIHSFIPSFIYSSIQSSIRPFIHSIIHPYIHSFIYQFLHSFIPQIIKTVTTMSVSHKGWFEFSVCDISDGNPAKEPCFRPLEVVDITRWAMEFDNFQTKWLLLDKDFKSNPTNLTIEVRLPKRFTCNHCVLRSYWNCGKMTQLGLGFARGAAPFTGVTLVTDLRGQSQLFPLIMFTAGTHVEDFNQPWRM